MRFRTLSLAAGVIAALPAVTVAAPEFYGKLNLSLEQVADYPAGTLEQSIEAVSNAENPLADQWQVESRKSRLGLRGEEALTTGGLDVIYQVELGIDMDDDEDEAVSFRNSYLGVSSASFGRVFAGRYDSVVKQIEGDVDAFGDTAADMETTFVGQRRHSNTVNWQSNDLGGLRVLAQVAPGEGAGGEDGFADTVGLGVTFTQGALYGALAYEKGFVEEEIAAGPPPVFDALDVKVLRGVVGLDLGGGLHVGAAVERAEVDGDDGLSLLVSGRMEANERLTFKGQVARFDSSDLDVELTTITLGADYKLGRATKAYGLFSLSDADAGDDESGHLIAVGLSHSF